MKLIKVINNATGKETNRWTTVDTPEDHYEPSMGLPERPEIDEQGEPTGVTIPAEYTIVIEDITAETTQAQINAEARAYLAATDYLIIREMDNGTPCPTEVKQARAAARAQIV